MAKIETVAQLNDTISALLEDIDFNTTLLSNKMNSNTTNLVFEHFEKTIDKLYEKSRYIKDLREFTLKYINTEYSNNKKEIDRILVNIETASDDYQNKGIIVHEITSNNKSEIFTDRDGAILTHADNDESRFIIPSNSNISDKRHIAQMISTNINDIPYKRISNQSIGAMSILYLSDSADDNKHTEIIQYIFDSSCVINYIDIQFFGAELNNVMLIKPDGSTLQAHDTILQEPIEIKGFEVTLTSNDSIPKIILQKGFSEESGSSNVQTYSDEIDKEALL